MPPSNDAVPAAPSCTGLQAKEQGGIPQPQVSNRIMETADPIMVKMREVVALNKNAMNLAQGIVHWQPPAEALEAVAHSLPDPATSCYGDSLGLRELRDALHEKIRLENGLLDSSVLVTAGSQQAFLNLVVALLDAGDAAVLFSPFYFSHQMALQMTGITDIRYGPCDPNTLHPDADWLLQELSLPPGVRPRLVVVTNPNNPTGAYVPPALVQRIVDICRDTGTWLVLDNAYEHFLFGGRQHLCLEAPHVLNLFSFSKSFGLMGWRAGYIAYSNASPELAAALLKAHETALVHAPLTAQRAALACLRHGGRAFVLRHVAALRPNLEAARDALSVLGAASVKGGEGGIFLWARLPPGRDGAPADDMAVVRWLAERHGVVVVPGSPSGGPGWIRVAFANLPPARYQEAAARLKRGLQELVELGMVEG